MNWASVAAALVAVVGGALAYLLQKMWDRQETLRAERKLLYRDLLFQVRGCEHSTLNERWERENEIYEEWLKTEAMLIIFAPDDVALNIRKMRYKYLSYKKIFQARGYDQELYDAFVEKLYTCIFAMRKDVREEATLDPSFSETSFLNETPHSNSTPKELAGILVDAKECE